MEVEKRRWRSGVEVVSWLRFHLEPVASLESRLTSAVEKETMNVLLCAEGAVLTLSEDHLKVTATFSKVGHHMTFDMFFSSLPLI